MKDNIKEMTPEGHNIKVKTKNGYERWLYTIWI